MGGGFIMFGLGALTAWTYLRHEHEASGCPFNRSAQQPGAGTGTGFGAGGGWPRWQHQQPPQPAESEAAQRPADAGSPSLQQRDWEKLQALGRHAGERVRARLPV
jgi:hypothetical protein